MQNNQQVLEKAIQKAIDGGWNREPTIRITRKTQDGRPQEAVLVETIPTDYIYTHDFCKALWGEGYAWFTQGQSGDTLPSDNYRNYIGHLANMVVAEDPLKYLADNM